MADTILSGIFSISSGTSTQWAATSKVIPSGVLCWETDTNFLKIGNGVSSYANLPYLTNQMASLLLGDGFVSSNGKLTLALADKTLTMTNAGLKVTSQRIPTTGPLTLYVSPSGSDTNDGLTAATPFATLQAAWNALAYKYDLAGYKPTIRLADGIYTSGLLGRSTLLGQAGQVNIVGNTSSPENVFIDTTGVAINMQFAANCNVSYLKIRAAAALSASRQGCIVLGDGLIFDTASVCHLYARYGGNILAATSTYTIIGGAPAHVQSDCASAELGSVTGITINNTPNFSTGFAVAMNNGYIGCPSVGGTTTGPRYFVTNNGVINTYKSGDETVLPGSIAGSKTNGGVYF